MLRCILFGVFLFGWWDFCLFDCGALLLWFGFCRVSLSWGFLLLQVSPAFFCFLKHNSLLRHERHFFQGHQVLFISVKLRQEMISTSLWLTQVLAIYHFSELINFLPGSVPQPQEHKLLSYLTYVSIYPCKLDIL